MNNIRNFALIGVCLLCISAVVGTLVPFNVQASDPINNDTIINVNAEQQKIEALQIEGEENKENSIHGTYADYVVETYIEDIPYGTVEIGVDTIPRDSVEVVSEGVYGKIRRTYLVKRDEEGNVADKTLYTEFPMTSPVDEVVNVGIGGTVTAKDGTVYNYNYRKEVEATAYTYMPPYTTMTTATGETLRKGIVAVDPKVIPYHTKMFITGPVVEYGLGVAEDCGGAIKGDKIDLAYMSYQECIEFGRRPMTVYILD